MTIDADARPARVDAWNTDMRDLGDEILAYDRAENRVHVLNSTARDIYRRCDGTRTIAQIGDELVRLYDADPETILQDLQATLERLTTLGLVTFDPS